jgi:hypothetical protein
VRERAHWFAVEVDLTREEDDVGGYVRKVFLHAPEGLPRGDLPDGVDDVLHEAQLAIISGGGRHQR